MDAAILMRVKEHINSHRYIYILMALVFAVYMVPLLFLQMPLGHDVWFHMARIDGLAGEITSGNIPARIYSSAFYGYGYGAPLFYGDWLLYIPAALVAGGWSVIKAYKTFIMMCALLAALSAYFSAKTIFDDKRSACVTAVLFCISTYFVTDIFIRHANGEVQSFIFIPIAFAGLYDIILGDCKRWTLLPLGLCGVLVTHTLTAAMSIVFFALFVLLHIAQIIEKPKKLLFIAISAGMFLLLSASFMLPMLEQMSSGTFLATDGYSAGYHGSLSARSMPSVYSLFSIYNSTEYLSGNNYFIPQGVGLALPMIMGWLLFYYKKTRSWKIASFLFLALFALFMTSRYFPWAMLQKAFGTIQFPWRIMMFATLFIALFGGAMAKKLGFTQHVSVFFAVIIVISFYSAVNTLYGSYGSMPKIASVDIIADCGYDNNIGLGEYLPTGTDKEALEEGEYEIRSNEHLADFTAEKDGGVFFFEFQNNGGENTFVDLPLIMYKGYKATLKTDGKTVGIPVAASTAENGRYENNLVRVFIGNAIGGTVTVWYEGTPVQKWSLVITLLSFGGLILHWANLYKKSRKENDRSLVFPEEAPDTFPES